ncbi:MAG TPA: choice-of-anchor Q domain-containing protein [Rhodanobacteraceae bacterium]|nr:choice-of-anchor Q domain-containing protein [Rhodanobacteraceae bacterium]
MFHPTHTGHIPGRIPPRTHYLTRAIRGALALTAVAGLAMAPSAFAANYTVTSLADDGSAGTLRTAIETANDNPGPDTITFSSSLSGTITLANGELEVYDDLTITGPAAAGALTIDGNGDNTAIRSSGEGGPAINLALSHLTITNGSDFTGGGIDAYNTNLVISDSVITGNDAGFGAGIYVEDGSLNLVDSSVTDNYAAYSGGGIYSDDADISINGSTISGNATVAGSQEDRGGGGGIAQKYGALAVASSTISGNSTTRNGGGIYIALSGQSVTLDDVTISDNVADNYDSGGTGGLAAVASEGPSQTLANSSVTITNSTISGNSGILAGGVSADTRSEYADATLTIINTTISANTAIGDAGGLYFDGGSLTIGASSIRDNVLTTSSPWGGGGIYVSSATALITDSTISGNVAQGADEEEPPGYLTGGLYFWDSNVSLVDCTVTDNHVTGNDYLAGGLSESNGSSGATGDIGPLAIGGSYGVNLVNTTIVGNTASGAPDAGYVVGGVLIGAYQDGALDADNSAVTENTGDTASDILGVSPALMSVNHSLVGTALQGTLGGTGNVYSDAPGLAPLADNGGPTQTMLPQPGSPLIDAGDTNATAEQYDQRGAPFARVVGAAIDIGAIEVQAAAPPPASATVPVPGLGNAGKWTLGGLLSLLGLLLARRRGDMGQRG